MKLNTKKILAMPKGRIKEEVIPLINSLGIIYKKFLIYFYKLPLRRLLKVFSSRESILSFVVCK